ncbi:MAG: superoxide dismutase family protein, partial [Corynebacterium variabile]
VSTDRVTKENLLDDDGSALIIHESPDNYGNIPERYAEDGPDEDSLKTGDAGGRQACGVFEAA